MGLPEGIDYDRPSSTKVPSDCNRGRMIQSQDLQASLYQLRDDAKPEPSSREPNVAGAAVREEADRSHDESETPSKRLSSSRTRSSAARKLSFARTARARKSVQEIRSTQRSVSFQYL